MCAEETEGNYTLSVYIYKHTHTHTHTHLTHTHHTHIQMEKCAEETEGNCTLPALKLGATMRALGQNISDRDAMRLALNSSIIDSQVRP